MIGLFDSLVGIEENSTVIRKNGKLIITEKKLVKSITKRMGIMD
jgi:hypothetical protein